MNSASRAENTAAISTPFVAPSPKNASSQATSRDGGFPHVKLHLKVFRLLLFDLTQMCSRCLSSEKKTLFKEVTYLLCMSKEDKQERRRDKKNGGAELVALGHNWRILQADMCSNKYMNSSCQLLQLWFSAPLGTSSKLYLTQIKKHDSRLKAEMICSLKLVCGRFLERKDGKNKKERGQDGEKEEREGWQNMCVCQTGGRNKQEVGQRETNRESKRGAEERGESWCSRDTSLLPVICVWGQTTF